MQHYYRVDPDTSAKRMLIALAGLAILAVLTIKGALSGSPLAILGAIVFVGLAWMTFRGGGGPRDVLLLTDVPVLIFRGRRDVEIDPRTLRAVTIVEPTADPEGDGGHICFLHETGTITTLFIPGIDSLLAKLLAINADIRVQRSA